MAAKKKGPSFAKMQEEAQGRGISISYKLTPKQRRLHPKGTDYRLMNQETLGMLLRATRGVRPGGEESRADQRARAALGERLTAKQRDKLAAMSYADLQTYLKEKRGISINYKLTEEERRANPKGPPFRFFDDRTLRAIYAAVHDAAPQSRKGPERKLPKDLRRLDPELCNDGADGKPHYGRGAIRSRARALGIPVDGAGGKARFLSTLCKELKEKGAEIARKEKEHRPAAGKEKRRARKEDHHKEADEPPRSRSRSKSGSRRPRQQSKKERRAEPKREERRERVRTPSPDSEPCVPKEEKSRRDERESGEPSSSASSGRIRLVVLRDGALESAKRALDDLDSAEELREKGDSVGARSRLRDIKDREREVVQTARRLRSRSVAELAKKIRAARRELRNSQSYSFE